MANTFSNTQLVLFDVMRRVKNNLVFAKAFDQSYSSYFGKPGAKVGDTINEPKPQYFQAVDGASITFQDITDLTIPIKLNLRSNTSYALDSQQKKMNADNVKKKYGVGAARALVNKIDAGVASYAALMTPNWVGTLGTKPTTNAAILKAGVVLDNYGAPMDENRVLLVSPQQMADQISVDSTLFNAQNTIGTEFRTAKRGTLVHGFDWGKSQNTLVFTTGNYAGTPLINGANQTGFSINVDGFSAGATVKQGDKFSLPIGAVNIETKQLITGQTKQFVITAAQTADGSGVMNGLQIYPAINPTGALQNVANAPADNAPLTFWAPANTTGTIGVAAHEEAYTVTFGNLDVPEDKEMGDSATDPDTGARIRTIQWYDGYLDKWPVRYDALWGVSSRFQEWAVCFCTD